MTREFKVNNFDLLRIFAASQVMVAHALWHLSIPTSAHLKKLIGAFPGVPIFFVISGFLISAAYERNDNISKFFRNRFLRIFPGLWACIIITVVVATIYDFRFLHYDALVWFTSQLIGIIYTPSFLKEFGFGSYNGSLWTIPVELQFYLLTPFLYALIIQNSSQKYNSRLLSVWVFFLFAAYIILYIASTPESVLQKLVRYSFLPHFYLFLTGVLLQRTRFYQSSWMTGRGLYWLICYLALYYTLPPSSATSIGLMLLLALTTVSIAYTVPNFAKKTLNGNDISYGVYIYHGLLINIFIQAKLTGNIVYFLALAVCTYIAGYISWKAVEKPFLRKKVDSVSIDANQTRSA